MNNNVNNPDGIVNNNQLVNNQGNNLKMNNNLMGNGQPVVNNQTVNSQMTNNQQQVVNNSVNLQSGVEKQVVKQDNKQATKAIKTDFSDKPNTKIVKMKRFNYKVKDVNGKTVESYFDAEKQSDVEAFLLNKGDQIISITEDKLSTSLGLASLSSSKKMNAKDLNFFLTQLSTYVKSGIPLVEAMEILSRQAKKSGQQMLYRKIVFELNRGVPFSECLAKQGNTFPKMLINMLKTSEMTGDLTGVLDDMATHYKIQDSNRKQIINAMTYPSVLMVFAIAVLTFVLTYVVPSFTQIYDSLDSELPAITQIIMNTSDFIIANWYYILAILAVVVLVYILLFKAMNAVKYGSQWFLMHIPVVKDLIIYNQLVTFTGTFATLIKHDVFITDSMDILRKITDNEIYKKIIEDAITNLSKGNGVSIAFKGHWAFPDTAYEMLVTGEKTGKLGEMLEHVAAYFQEEQTNMIARMKSLVEPLMIILLAVIVGIVLLAVVLPMFGMYGEMI